MLKAAAVKLTATLGTGEKRPQTTEALVGVSDTVDPKPRSPEALAALLVEPEASRARRQREETRDEAPRAQQVRRLASLVRTKPAVMELIQADAERRDPQHRNAVIVLLDGALGLWHLATTRCKPWKHVTLVLDIMHVVGDLWSAANACVRGSIQGGPALGAAEADGETPRPGGRRRRRPATHPHQAAAAEVGAGDARERHHVRPHPSALDAVRRVPGDVFARWDRRRRVGVRFGGPAPDGGRRHAVEPRRSRGHADVARAQQEP